MCIAPQPDKSAEKTKKEVADGTIRPIRATEVPLGNGLADSAKRSIMSRREQIRRAVEGE